MAPESVLVQRYTTLDFVCYCLSALIYLDRCLVLESSGVRQDIRCESLRFGSKVNSDMADDSFTNHHVRIAALHVPEAVFC